MPDSAELHYNMGLLYADLEMHAEAMQHAREAYRRGFPLPGLKRRLQQAGAWTPLAAQSASPKPDGE